MLKKVMLSVVALVAMTAIAGAATFSADGGLLEPTHGYTTIADRALVNDGDFEGGTCVDTPIWTCTTSSTCDWITDLVPLGLWNYSGAHVAWLGGFCGDAVIYTYICQDLDLTGADLTYFWMGYINAGGDQITIAIDGAVIFTYITDVADHLLDYQPLTIDISAYAGVHTLCFNYDLLVAGDNYFMDYIEIQGDVATEAANFSTVKALY